MMAIVNIYLNFNGQGEEAFTFYKSVFGGEFNYIGRFRDIPPSEDFPVAEADKDKIMHVGLPVSKETKLLGSDCDGNGNFVQGNNFSICVTPDSVEEARRLFDALSQGGVVAMPLEKTFWGSLFGILTDKFSINRLVDIAVDQ